MRKDVTLKTLDKVRKYLEKQSSPIPIYKIVHKLQVDFYSLKICLNRLNAAKTEEGIVLKREGKDEVKCTNR